MTCLQRIAAGLLSVVYWFEQFGGWFAFIIHLKICIEYVGCASHVLKSTGVLGVLLGFTI